MVTRIEDGNYVTFSDFIYLLADRAADIMVRLKDSNTSFNRINKAMGTSFEGLGPWKHTTYK